MGRWNLSVYVFSFAFGCASRTTPPTSVAQTATPGGPADRDDEQDSEEEQPQSLPEGFDREAALAQAERIGAALYRQDKLAWWASDALFADAAFPRGVVMAGWTVDLHEDGRVHFFSRSDEEVRWMATVDCGASGPKSCIVKFLAPTAAPTPEQSVILRARRTAHESAEFVPKTDRYNEVVLPAQLYGHGDGWLVYLLAASLDSNVMMLGGHYRFIVSADGGEVESARELTKSLLAMPKMENSAAAVVSHVLDPVPIETHVWASLLYEQPLFVTTSTGLYEVDRGRISASAPGVVPQG